MTSTIYLLLMGALIIPITSKDATNSTDPGQNVNTTEMQATEPPLTESNNVTNNISKEATETSSPPPPGINSTTETSGNTTKSPATDHTAKSPATKTILTPQVTHEPKDTSDQTIDEKPVKTSTTMTSQPTTKSHPHTGSNKIFIIIFSIGIICVIIVIFFCCYQRRSRRRSVDIIVKSEEAQIPLAVIELDMPDDNQAKDMKTFTAVENSNTAPENKEKTQEEKAPTEAVEQVKEAPAEAQDAVTPALKPSELLVDEIDEEPTISNKTSLETLDDLNENNSNSNSLQIIMNS